MAAALLTVEMVNDSMKTNMLQKILWKNTCPKSIIKTLEQPHAAFTCSKSTIETPEQCVKSLQN